MVKKVGMSLVLEDDRLTQRFGALANPTRRAILTRLAQGDATVNELAEPFEMTLPAISKHIKVLERAGLVTRGREAQSRPCSLRAEALEEVSTWADTLRPLWEARLDRLDDQVRKVHQRAETGSGDRGVR